MSLDFRLFSIKEKKKEVRKIIDTIFRVLLSKRRFGIKILI
jgi:hypothetical protein